MSEPTVLGIETSCDETSVAVVRGRTVLSNLVSSQASLHERWGGVVPEAAARAHVEAIIPAIHEGLSAAGSPKLDAIAVTNRPGLVGSLSVGVVAAQALAKAWDLPLIPVHHLEGHLLSPFLQPNSFDAPEFPYLALLVSGGHTELIAVEGYGEYQVLGSTRDDAAGEAFDKGAKLLGLPYPGGAEIEKLAAQFSGKPRYKIPIGLRSEPLDFSFSGMKTALLRLVEAEGDSLNVAEAAYVYQQAIVETLALKFVNALETRSFSGTAVAGGVAANKILRDRLQRESERFGVRFSAPDLSYCTDNAAMIAFVGVTRFSNPHSLADAEPQSVANLP